MRTPNSTYRIQLHAGFTLKHLDSILAYLHELGISTIYASPITRAIKGSQHGYDAADPLSINPEIGTEEEFAVLSHRLDNYGMTWLQDIVPNHMAFADSNLWLYDVLERGKTSEYYSYFDIDTHSSELTGDKLMAPFLGSTLTECLQKGELILDLTQRGFIIRYFANVYPVAVNLYLWIATVIEGCPPALIEDLRELEQSATTASASAWKTIREKIVDKIYANKEYLSFLQQRVHFFNHQPALLAQLTGGQHYILTHAHLAASRINYRRFFTVNSLICLRMEDQRVFDTWHQKIFSWYNKGYIHGLRLDHIDGLAAPRQYLERLRQHFGDDCYIVAEKILEEGEQMSADWPLQGMTGYEFLSPAGQVLTDPEGSRELLNFYQEQIADRSAYEEIVFEKKHRFLLDNMGGELDNLRRLFLTLPGAEASDPEQIKKALGLLLASFPVYRLYPDESPFSSESRVFLNTAFARAREKGPGCTKEFELLEQIFNNSDHLAFISRFMQFTGPLAAKGIEDTTFYVYHPYIAHNEVGDTPSIAGITPGTFHRKMADRLASLPYSLNATSTHDTKRGEDSRIRLNILSTMPEEWIGLVKKWSVMNRLADGPKPNDEYLIYQALLGGFPEDLIVTDQFRQRFHDYLTKALREGNTNTSYIHPDEAYEQHCHSFVTAILQPDSPFLEDFIPFAWQVIRESFIYSLSQLLIKLTAPGIPDIYQGSELWEISFVDPDNRRPVNYALRSSLLKEIKQEEEKGPAAALAFVLANRKKGAGKLFTLYRTLAYRNSCPEVFRSGDYIPVPAKGPVLAYLRRHKKDWVLIIVPLIRRGSPQPATIASLPLPPDAPTVWTNLFTGDLHNQDDLGKIWEKFPVALLTGQTP